MSPIASTSSDSVACSLAEEQLPVLSERLQTALNEDVLHGELAELQPPPWLTRLGLEQPRTGLRCLSLTTRCWKRALDIVVALALMVVAIPLVGVAAIAIKLTSPGPVLFTQVRVGLNARHTQRRRRRVDSRSPQCRRVTASYGRPFTIYKLRTMRAEPVLGRPRETVSGDPRITSVGRVLRRMRIDELPQLLNVLRGEMSMVGPRPECVEYMEELSEKIPGYLQRLGLKPGLTGIAQVEAGYANSIESSRRKVAFDLMYLQNCCVWNDIKIMGRTIRVVLTGFGAL